MVSLKEAIAIIAALIIVNFIVSGIFILQDYLTEAQTNPFTPEAIGPTASPPLYGCPGCPANFMDFSQDMCNRFGPDYTVSDGTNTLSCAEIESGGMK